MSSSKRHETETEDQTRPCTLAPTMSSPRACEMYVPIEGSTYASWGPDFEEGFTYAWGTPSKQGKGLRFAARFGQVRKLRMLLWAARQPTSPISLLELMGERDNIGCTALCIAALNGRLEVIRVLLAAGADKNVESEAGLTPLDVAFMKGHDSVASLLRDSGSRSSLSSESSAYVRARLGPRVRRTSHAEAEVDQLRPPHAMPKICRFWSSQADRGTTVLRAASAEGSRGVAGQLRPRNQVPGTSILRAHSAEGSRGVAEQLRPRDEVPGTSILRAASAEESRCVAERLRPHHEVPKTFQFWSKQSARRASSC